MSLSGRKSSRRIEPKTLSSAIFHFLQNALIGSESRSMPCKVIIYILPSWQPGQEERTTMLWELYTMGRVYGAARDASEALGTAHRVSGDVGDLHRNVD